MTTITYVCENCGKRREHQPFFYWLRDMCTKCKRWTRWVPYVLIQRARAQRAAQEKARKELSALSFPPTPIMPRKKPWWAFWRKS